MLFACASRLRLPAYAWLSNPPVCVCVCVAAGCASLCARTSLCASSAGPLGGATSPPFRLRSFSFGGVLFVAGPLAHRHLYRVCCSGWLVYETEIREIAVGPQANTTVALAQLAARDRTHSGAGLPGSPARGTAGLEHSGKLHVSSSGAVAAGSGGAGGGAVQEKPSGRERLSVPRQNWQRVLSAVMQRAAASQHRQGCVHNIGKPAPFSNPFLEGECYFRTSTSPHENDRRYFHGKKRMIDIQFKLRYKYKPEGFLYCGFEGTGGTTPAWSWGTRFAVKIARKIVAIRHPEFISEWGENITPICMLAYDTFWDTFFMDRGQDAGDGTGRRIYPDSPPLAGPANPMPTNRSHKQILDGEAEIDVGTQFTMSFYSRAIPSIFLLLAKTSCPRTIATHNASILFRVLSLSLSLSLSVRV